MYHCIMSKTHNENELDLSELMM